MAGLAHLHVSLLASSLFALQLVFVVIAWGIAAPFLNLLDCLTRRSPYLFLPSANYQHTFVFCMISWVYFSVVCQCSRFVFYTKAAREVGILQGPVQILTPLIRIASMQWARLWPLIQCVA